MATAEARRLLARNHVGRIAFRVRNRVEVHPVGYVTRGRWIYLRSADGTRVRALARDPYCAFEVDEVDGPFDWRSVVVHGTVYTLDPDGSPIERREYRQALRLFRAVLPSAFTPDDPVPERVNVYGINIHTMTGRTASTRPRGRAKG